MQDLTRHFQTEIFVNYNFGADAVSAVFHYENSKNDFSKLSKQKILW
jgi:hypothetical protein